MHAFLVTCTSGMLLCCLPCNTRRAARALLLSVLNQGPCATLLSSAEVLLAGPTQRYDGHKADIWSAGVVLYAMLFSRVPFEVHEGQDGQGNGGGVRDRAATIQRILAGDWGVPHGINVSPQVLHLLGQILVPDPNKRASMEKVGGGGWRGWGDDDARSGVWPCARTPHEVRPTSHACKRRSAGRPARPRTWVCAAP